MFDSFKKRNARIRKKIYRDKNGTREELDQQIRSYASNPELRERKKNKYQEEKKQQKIWEKQEEEKRILNLAQEWLLNNEEMSRRKNLEGSDWLKKCFAEIFEEFKNFNPDTKEKIDNLEKSIENKFKRINEEIDYKVKRWKAEMEWSLKDIRVLLPIFDDFTTGIKCHNYGKPLREQNRIDIIWHDLKQHIEVKLDDISIGLGYPLENIPWHGILCNICNIYRDWKTNMKYVPPRFAHEQDPDFIP